MASCSLFPFVCYGNVALADEARNGSLTPGSKFSVLADDVPGCRNPVYSADETGEAVSESQRDFRARAERRGPDYNHE